MGRGAGAGMRGGPPPGNDPGFNSLCPPRPRNRERHPHGCPQEEVIGEVPRAPCHAVRWGKGNDGPRRPGRSGLEPGPPPTLGEKG